MVLTFYLVISLFLCNNKNIDSLNSFRPGEEWRFNSDDRLVFVNFLPVLSGYGQEVIAV